MDKKSVFVINKCQNKNYLEHVFDYIFLSCTFK